MKTSNETIRRNTFKTHFYLDSVEGSAFDFPQVYAPTKIMLDKECLPFNIFMTKSKQEGYGVHFFLDDYYFERVWNNVEAYIPALRKARFVLGTDFSVFTDMPKAVQIYNTYRNRAITAYLQARGVKIIPVVSWSDKNSFEWCFDGIEKGSVVAVGTSGVMQNKEVKESFLVGYNKMLEVLKPKQVVVVGRVPKEIESPIITSFPSYSQIVYKKIKGGV